MPLAKEELAARISSFRNDLRIPNATVAGVTTLCFAISTVAVIFAVGLAVWCAVLVSVTIGVGALWWWFAHLKALRRKHGLLCLSCGRFVTKSGFRGVLSTSCCEWCNSAL
jgi:hypothetical protein